MTSRQASDERGSVPPERPKSSRYFYLTVGWAACLLLSAAAGDASVLRALIPTTFTGLVVVAVVGISRDRRFLFAALLIGALWLGSLWLSFAVQEPTVVVSMACLGVSFIGIVAFSIASEFLRAREITADILWGAVGVYLLVGTAFGLVFLGIETLVPGSLSGALDERSYIYFSLVTMTTLGYGDIVPTTELARLVAAFAAICGIMYTAVVVARLVAIEILSSTSRRK